MSNLMTIGTRKQIFNFFQHKIETIKKKRKKDVSIEFRLHWRHMFYSVNLVPISFLLVCVLTVNS
jgi:hypothetical protein